MSEYRVIWPDEALDNDTVGVSEDGQAILQFRIPAPRSSLCKRDIVTRARQLFDNRTCPECSYPVVIPIELNDGQFNRNGLPIPGTATLVGFRCQGCRSEWSV